MTDIQHILDAMGTAMDQLEAAVTERDRLIADLETQVADLSAHECDEVEVVELAPDTSEADSLREELDTTTSLLTTTQDQLQEQRLSVAGMQTELDDLRVIKEKAQSLFG